MSQSDMMSDRRAAGCFDAGFAHRRPGVAAVCPPPQDAAVRSVRVAVELQEESSVAELKEVVGSQQGVRPENLRVLFAGRELRSTATLQVSPDQTRPDQTRSSPNLPLSSSVLLCPPLSSSQSCDLPEQSTVHVVLPPSGSSSSCLLLLQERLSKGGQEEQSRLTRLDLSSLRLPSTSSGLAVILEGSDGERGDGEEQGGGEEVTEAQAAPLKGVL
ncbi:E3 ubiquitin-protein ligase parkin [Collichthys lucidus]|uniref:E3 ubiquitin-protein ligase parkin n=1 Tax=Collichthys lucidus TaxID=240159 RepID=A0A4U5TV14_COLLU|nr:E3 ubiquitin-protein ligase parkin [Collichthys lucidus]